MSGQRRVDHFLFLGTGASAGVPVVGCKCSVCLSKKTKNFRFRPSGILRLAQDNRQLLIDATPDFRSQALQFGIDRLDGLLLTHTHFDHIAGIDDLRIFNAWQKQNIPCLLSRESFDDLQHRYPYFFDETAQSAKFAFTRLDAPMGEIEFCNTKIGYCSYRQARMGVMGFRVGHFAYISDIRHYEASIFSFLKGVQVLVIGALRPDPSPLHLSFDEAIAFSRKVGAQETWLTHLGHFVDHDDAHQLLPAGVRLAYDGLEIACTK